MFRQRKEHKINLHSVKETKRDGVMNDPLSLFIHILVPLLFHDIYILKRFPLVRLIFEFGQQGDVVLR